MPTSFPLPTILNTFSFSPFTNPGECSDISCVFRFVCPSSSYHKRANTGSVVQELATEACTREHVMTCDMLSHLSAYCYNTSTVM